MRSATLTQRKPVADRRRDRALRARPCSRGRLEHRVGQRRAAVFSITSTPASWTSQLNSTPVASSTRARRLGQLGPGAVARNEVTLCATAADAIRAVRLRCRLGGTRALPVPYATRRMTLAEAAARRRRARTVGCRARARDAAQRVGGRARSAAASSGLPGARDRLPGDRPVPLPAEARAPSARPRGREPGGARRVAAVRRAPLARQPGRRQFRPAPLLHTLATTDPNNAVRTVSRSCACGIVPRSARRSSSCELRNDAQDRAGRRPRTRQSRGTRRDESLRAADALARALAECVPAGRTPT